jgi:predicted metal-dependent hydrolase
VKSPASDTAEVGIPYTLRRSTRARRVGVTVDGARGVEVVLPRRVFDRGAGAREREAAAAIRELRPWIERRMRELERARAAVAARSGTIPYLGQPLRLIAQPGRTRAHRRGMELLVPEGDTQLRAIERFYRRAAQAEISWRLDRACAQVGASYARLEIRGQRTRWASCSRSGTMSFNWRLLLAPEPVLDYVVWHEVCHLEVMDHSPRFWKLLGERCPRYREYVRWLRRHGGTLVL